MSHDPAQLVFLRDEEDSVSPLYLIQEMIGILMDYAGPSSSNAGHIYSGIKSSGE